MQSFLSRQTITIVHVIVIAAVGLFMYSNTFDVPFQFDDTPFIVENPAIKNLAYFKEPSKTKDFPHHDMFRSRFIGFLTFALNYRAHGLYVTGYHVVNLIIHIINAVLVYMLVVLSFRTPFLIGSTLKDSSRLIALFSSLLFISHPIQTQAVTYIWQRVASLATMFYCLSLVTYIKWKLLSQRNPKTWSPPLFFYMVSIVSAILAMKTKENSFTLPLSIALYEFTFFEGKAGRRLSYHVPFFLTLLIIPLSMIDIGRPVGELIGDVSLATKSQTEMSRWDYLLTQFRVIVTYIRLVFLPVGQNLDYDYPIYHSLINAEVIMSFLFLLSLITFGIFMFYRSKDKGELRLAAFGALWFFITLMVESSLIPIVDVIFEQRVYLPSVGAFSAITVSAFFLIKRQRRQQKLATVLVVFILIVLSCATHARNIVWQSEISLWEDNALKSPSKFRVIVNLADAYVKNGRLTESIDALDKALTMPEGMKPESAEAYNVLGVAFLRLQEYGRANRAFLKAITLNPGHPNTYSSLAALYGELGDFVSAAKASKKAIELNPYDKTAYNNLGLAYASTEHHLKAIAMYKKSIGINPYYAEARYNLALSYLAIGNKGGAISEYNLLKDLNQALTDKLLIEIKEAQLE